MTDQINLSYLRNDTYYAYLAFCADAKEVPRKEVFTLIKSCDDGEKLLKTTSWIESCHADFLKEKKRGFWSRIFKF